MNFGYGSGKEVVVFQQSHLVIDKCPVIVTNEEIEFKSKKYKDKKRTVPPQKKNSEIKFLIFSNIS